MTMSCCCGGCDDCHVTIQREVPETPRHCPGCRVTLRMSSSNVLAVVARRCRSIGLGFLVFLFLIGVGWMRIVDPAWTQPILQHLVSEPEQVLALPTPLADTTTIRQSFWIPALPDKSILTRMEQTLKHNQSEFNSSLFSNGDNIMNCPPTLQVQVHISEDPNRNNYTIWTLQTYDAEGRPKTVGGDEFLPVYFDETRVAANPRYGNRYIPTAVAHVTDHGDGTYDLDFWEAPFEAQLLTEAAGRGRLDLWFDYTCGIGRMTRPSKDHWRDGGYLYTKHSLENITSPTIRPFAVPQPLVDLSKYDKVICFGDSMVSNLCGKFWNKYYFRMPNAEYQDNVGAKLMRHNWKEEAMPLLDQWHGEVLNSSRSQSNVALLIGTGTWELASNKGPLEDNSFSDSVQMHRELVPYLKETYPNVQIVFKPISAPHLSALEEGKCHSRESCRERVRYLSTSSAYFLYQQQKNIMTQVFDDDTVLFLDLWSASYPSYDWHMPGDAIHYHKWQNQFFMEVFYGAKTPPRRRIDE